MQGELVIVRAYGGEALIRRLWDWDSEAVYICNEENFQKLASGVDEVLAVGFPRRDVFYYDYSIEEQFLESLKVDPLLWNDLELWEGGENVEG